MVIKLVNLFFGSVMVKVWVIGRLSWWSHCEGDIAVGQITVQRACLTGAGLESTQMFAFVDPSIKHMIKPERESHTASGQA